MTSRTPPVIVVWPGENVTLNCSGVGPPAPQVYWTKESRRLKHDRDGQLRFLAVSHKDSATYRCHAVNYLGRDTQSTAVGKTLLYIHIFTQ